MLLGIQRRGEPDQETYRVTGNALAESLAQTRSLRQISKVDTATTRKLEAANFALRATRDTRDLRPAERPMAINTLA